MKIKLLTTIACLLCLGSAYSLPVVGDGRFWAAGVYPRTIALEANGHSLHPWIVVAIATNTDQAYAAMSIRQGSIVLGGAVPFFVLANKNRSQFFAFFKTKDVLELPIVPQLAGGSLAVPLHLEIETRALVEKKSIVHHKDTAGDLVEAYEVGATQARFATVEAHQLPMPIDYFAIGMRGY